MSQMLAFNLLKISCLLWASLPGRNRIRILQIVYRFEHTNYLIGLGGLILLGAALFLLYDWKKKTAAKMGDPALIKQLISNFSKLKFAVKAGLLLAAFAIIILTAANPQKQGNMQNIQRKGVDVMLVLDVSKSMLA